MAQTPSRRDLLGTALLAPFAALPRAAGTANPDAELVAVAADSGAAFAEIGRLEASPASIPDETYAPLDRRRWVARDRACELPATTWGGIRAKASIFLAEMDVQCGPDYEEASAHEHVGRSLALDILRHARLGGEG